MSSVRLLTEALLPCTAAPAFDKALQLCARLLLASATCLNINALCNSFYPQMLSQPLRLLPEQSLLSELTWVVLHAGQPAHAG